MEKRKGYAVAGIITLLILMLFMWGCQAVFTYSPLSILQRDPSSLPASAQKTYAEDALASGDSEAIAKAYSSITALLADNPDDPGLNLLAAKLGVEVSGVPKLIDQIVQGELDLSDPNAVSTISDFISAGGVDPQVMVQAGEYYKAADANGGELSSTDYIMGSLGILLGAAEDANGNFNSLETPGTWSSTAQSKAQSAADFLNEGLTGLPADDPARSILEGFSGYIGNFTS
ncbi:MAG: hypothetical protein GXP33_13930 [Spirochaetes bacterium]|nr:hypothetical protein [Spirochaetota bacterium]